MKNILGVSITTKTPQEIEALIASYLGTPGFHRVATVNPEFLVRANRDERFRANLNAADLCVPDGIGIVWAGRLRGERMCRYPGADLMATILRIANARRLPVFLAVRADGLSSYEEACRAIRQNYPGVIIDGSNVTPHEIFNLQSSIFNSKIVLCNFGAPDQEYFCEVLRAKPGEVRVALGVGGAFDFLTEKRKRAPKWMRAIGLEWLWRLMIQPGRLGRIFAAIVVFPWLVLREKKNERSV